jgi:hypothetical protein
MPCILSLQHIDKRSPYVIYVQTWQVHLPFTFHSSHPPPPSSPLDTISLRPLTILPPDHFWRRQKPVGQSSIVGGNETNLDPLRHHHWAFCKSPSLIWQHHFFCAHRDSGLNIPSRPRLLSRRKSSSKKPLKRNL